MTVPALSLNGSSSWPLLERTRRVPRPLLVNVPPCAPPPLVRLPAALPPMVSVPPASLSQVAEAGLLAAAEGEAAAAGVVEDRAVAAERVDRLAGAVEIERRAAVDAEVGEVGERAAGGHRQGAAAGN